MRLAVFDSYRIGVVTDGQVRDVTDILPSWLDNVPKQRMNWLIEHWGETQAKLQAHLEQSPSYRLSDVRLRAASPAPAHVFALPTNFVSHLDELGDLSVSRGRSAREMGFFLKAPGSLTGGGDVIRLPLGSMRRFDHECELAVVIGKRASDVAREDAIEHVFGYSCLIDVTMRMVPGTHEEERSMRKSFSSFTPLGPYLVTADSIGALDQQVSTLRVNGEIRQETSLALMVVDIAEAIELISSVVPLEPGDVIATGTPSGVGPVEPGDEVQIDISGVGSMSLAVARRDRRSPWTF